MGREFLLSLVLTLLVVLLLLLPLGWFARRRRQRGIAAPTPTPAEVGAEVGAFVGTYLATTTAGDPLDRIAVHSFGFRSSVTARVTNVGLLLVRPGEQDIWIPRADLLDHRRASWTIDRAVEPNGLQLIEWRLGSHSVETYLRLENPSGFDHALDSIITTERHAL